MKIGILTYHCAHNYGAVLQAYATKEFLTLQGHDVYMIDYRPEAIVRRYKLTSKRFIRKNPISIIKELLITKSKKLKHDRYVKFINNLNLTKEINVIPDSLDAYIIGSDQVWNPNITKRFEPYYFADFPFDKGNKKYISYAASAETKALTVNEVEFYKANLVNFDRISVREQELLDLLQPLTEENITKVLDPTLLLKKEEWDRVATIPKIDKKYVLVYQVRKDARTIIYANEIAKQLDAVVIQLDTDVNYSNFKDPNIDEVAGPNEFVGWIKNATCVITTSFHGTAFSLIYGKDFYSIMLSDGKNTRSISLLKAVGLEDRMVSFSDKPRFTSIDYNKSALLLENEVNKSSAFLLNVLK